MAIFKRTDKVREIFESDDLKKLSDNNAYWNNKQIDDAIFGTVSWMVRLLPILAVAVVLYIIYYYQFEAHKPEYLISLAVNFLIYVAGIITPTVKRALEKSQ